MTLLNRAELEAACELERRVLGTFFDEAEYGSPMSVSASADSEAEHPEHPGLGIIDLRLTLPHDLAGFWSDLEGAPCRNGRVGA